LRTEGWRSTPRPWHPHPHPLPSFLPFPPPGPTARCNARRTSPRAPPRCHGGRTLSPGSAPVGIFRCFPRPPNPASVQGPKKYTRESGVKARARFSDRYLRNPERFRTRKCNGSSNTIPLYWGLRAPSAGSLEGETQQNHSHLLLSGTASLLPSFTPFPPSLPTQ
jgi:hypothetical protein